LDAFVCDRQLIEIAKDRKISTINLVRRDDAIQPLKDLGADFVINSSKEGCYQTKRFEEFAFICSSGLV
jgi:NADPH:quinone reductase-like Zn-dependent oxidoreductase